MKLNKENSDDVFKGNESKSSKKGFLRLAVSIVFSSIIFVFCLVLVVSIYVFVFDKESTCSVKYEAQQLDPYYLNSDLYKNNDSIELDFFAEESEKIIIDNPVNVSGRADVYEATVYIRIVDLNGKVLADTFTTASGWMDDKYPFNAEISYSEPGSNEGFIEVFENNPKNGEESNKVVVPVVFNY